MFAVPKFIKILMGCIFLCTANSVLANNTGYRISLGYTAISIVMDFGESEGDSLSSIYIITNNFRLNMPKSAKITNPANNSSKECTPQNGAKSVVSAIPNIPLGKFKFVKISKSDSSQELRIKLQSVLSEFIDCGLIDVNRSKI